MRTLLLAICLTGAVSAQPTTTITDTVHDNSGNPATAVITIVNAQFSQAGYLIPASTRIIKTDPVSIGAVSFNIVPNDNPTPAMTYNIKITIGQTVTNTFWLVPTSDVPQTLSQITIPKPGPVNAQILLTQLSPQPYLDAGDAGTGADTTEDDLMTYTLPANRLTTGKYLRITAAFTGGDSAAQGRLYWGSYVICNQTFGTGQMVFNVWIIGLSGNTQKCVCAINDATDDAVYDIIVISNVDSTAPIIIKGTGQNTTPEANNVNQRLLIVEPGN